MTPTNTPTPTSSPTPTSVLPTASPTSVPSPTPIPAGYVQSNLTYATDFVSSQSTTFSNSVGNGNLVVVGISVYSIGTANISTVTDNKGNIYNRAVSGPSNHDNVSIWYAENVIGGEGFTVTASPSQGATVGITLAIHEYRGMLTSNSLDRPVPTAVLAETLLAVELPPPLPPKSLFLVSISKARALPELPPPAPALPEGKICSTEITSRY
jgi:hypothetical protein